MENSELPFIHIPYMIVFYHICLIGIFMYVCVSLHLCVYLFLRSVC